MPHTFFSATAKSPDPIKVRLPMGKMPSVKVTALNLDEGQSADFEVTLLDQDGFMMATEITLHGPATYNVTELSIRTTAVYVIPQSGADCEYQVEGFHK